ncbi:MAG TPA: D-aminoacyl-tRNA deacylase [Ignavibacteria bacterium]|nr:D-aminoacyl-tRNA deacylase [Ignavibacteria bacterium]
MLALVQRVLEASVSVDSEIFGAVNDGFLVFLGIKQDDNEAEAKYLAAKTANLRVFNDAEGKMNVSLLDTGYSALVVSQFTLHADTRHGNRPSFTDAAEPKHAEELYKIFIDEMKYLIGFDKVSEGKFGAMMKIKLINDGPVTVTLKSKNEY